MFFQDLFYHPSNHNNPGWIISKLKTRRNAANIVQSNADGEHVASVSECIELNESQQQELLDQLRSMVVTDQNIHSVKELLDKTEVLRAKLMKQDDINLLISFPSFFTNTELVGYKFINIFTHIYVPVGNIFVSISFYIYL